MPRVATPKAKTVKPAIKAGVTAGGVKQGKAKANQTRAGRLFAGPGVFGRTLGRVNSMVGRVMYLVNPAYMLGAPGMLILPLFGKLTGVPYLGKAVEALRKPEEYAADNTIGDLERDAKELFAKHTPEFVQDGVTSVSNLVGEVSMPKAAVEAFAGVLKKAATPAAEYYGGQAEAHNVTNAISDIDNAGFSGESIDAIREAALAKNPAAVAKEFKAIKKDKSTGGVGHEKLLKYAKEVAVGTKAERRAEILKNPSKALSELPNKIRAMNVQEAVYKASVYGNMASQAYGTYGGIRSGISTLKEMAVDLDPSVSSPKEVSTFKVLFSRKAPQAVKQARKALLKTVLPGIVMNFGVTAASLKLQHSTNKNADKFGYALMFASQLGSQMMSELGGNAIHSYHALAAAEAQGQPMQTTAIRDYLVRANSQLKKMEAGTESAATLLAAYASHKNYNVAQITQIANMGDAELKGLAQEVMTAAGMKESVGKHTAGLNQKRGNDYTLQATAAQMATAPA